MDNPKQDNSDRRTRRRVDPHAIDGYRISHVLGRGRAGTVFRAVQLAMQREVALKVLNPSLADAPGFSRRFIHEAQMAGAIQHANVVTCYDAGESGGLLYQTLELLGGGDLLEAAQTRSLSEKDIIGICLDCARGLEGIHGAGLAHCNIEPSNIFITEDGVAKLGDLGMARSLHAEGGQGFSQELGSDAFVAPENRDGARARDIRSDIYSLGAILFYLATGSQPLIEADDESTYIGVDEHPADPRSIDPDVGSGISVVCLRALAPDPAERYQSATELREDLERLSCDFAPLHARPGDASASGEASSIRRSSIHSSDSRGSSAARRRSATQVPEMPRPAAKNPSSRPSKGWPLLIGTSILLLLGLGLVFLQPDAGAAGDATSVSPRIPEPEKTAALPSSVAEAAASKAPPATTASIQPTWASAVGEDAAGRWALVAFGEATCRFRLIPAGNFQMGQGNKTGDNSLHQVTISRPFWLAETETTQEVWRAVTGNNPSHYTGPGLPVESVNLAEVQDFLQRAAAFTAPAQPRLPSEAEWEYACLAGQEAALLSQGWNLDALAKGTHPVASLQANAWGLHDMLGNVMEWVADGYSKLGAISETDPLHREGLLQVAKGGSWSVPKDACQPGARSSYQGDRRFFFLGFRIAIDAAPTELP